jgi:hypothetical protein
MLRDPSLRVEHIEPVRSVGRTEKGDRATPIVVFDTITVETFQKLRVIRPPDALLDRLEQAVRPMFSLMLNLSGRNRNLRTTRDLLLPKLISGEIPVESAQEALPASP